jgi:hypothetical protein
MASKKLILTLVCLTALSMLTMGCGSDDDSSPTAPVVDTAPPALPSGLDVDYAAIQRQATVSWDSNVTDSDFAGFLVSRGSYDYEPEALVAEPQAATTYVDNDLVGVGRQVTYYIYSVDTNGNVSAASTMTLNLPVDEVEPPQLNLY